MKKIYAGMLFFVFGVFLQYSFAESPKRAVFAQNKPSTTPSVLSIIPAQAEPGTTVAIFGSGFGNNVSVYLGITEITPKLIESRKIEFIIPIQLEPGMYALNIRRADGAVGRVYNFNILPLKPYINSLQPDTMSTCATGNDREITVLGQNFSEKSMVLFDDAVIKSRFISQDAIAFQLPQVDGGLHKVMIKNPPDIASVTHALTVDNKPEISQVFVGKDHVNYYELIISGKNFNQNSAVFIDGKRVEGTSVGRDKLMFIDCTKLIYHRYPYSPISKDFQIQVVNQGGIPSNVANVSAP